MMKQMLLSLVPFCSCISMLACSLPSPQGSGETGSEAAPRGTASGSSEQGSSNAGSGTAPSGAASAGEMAAGSGVAIQHHVPPVAEDPWARMEAVQREVERMTPIELAEKAVAETEASARVAKAAWISESLRTKANLQAAKISEEQIDAVLARSPQIATLRSGWLQEMEIAAAARADLERLRAAEGSGHR